MRRAGFALVTVKESTKSRGKPTLPVCHRHSSRLGRAGDPSKRQKIQQRSPVASTTLLVLKVIAEWTQSDLHPSWSHGG